MRAISDDLLSRIKESQQTVYKNANIALKVLISKGYRKELFRVYTVHNDSELGKIDSAVRRSSTEDDPDKAYVVYIKDGMAHVKSKDLPYDETIPWNYEFELGAADDVAIEFTGEWERDEVSGKFNLVAEEYPWIFKISSGILTGQRWQDDTIELSTGVSNVCAIRGWKSIIFPEDDQGLIVAYLKSGVPYYKNYCYQVSGDYGWEVERQITGLSTDCVDIALFRTNDFRIGFIVQRTGGQIEYVVTERDWAGMAIPPEKLTFGLSDLTLSLSPVYQLVLGDGPIPTDDVRYIKAQYFGDEDSKFYEENLFVELESDIVFLTNETVLEIVKIEQESYTDVRTGEDLKPNTGDGTRTEFQLYWIPTEETEKIYVDEVEQERGTDYTISGRDVTFINAPVDGAVLTADYEWVNWGVKLKIEFSAGITDCPITGWSLEDEASVKYPISVVTATDKKKNWQVSDNYPPIEFIFEVQDFNVCIGDITLAYDATEETLLGETGQVITSSLSATITPENLQESIIDPPEVEVVWNE